MADDAFSGLLKPGGEQRIASIQPRPQVPASSAHGIDPQQALRGRLNAIILDVLVLGCASGVLLAVSGAPARSTNTFLLFFALQFAYFFGCEVRGGQTIGKRIFHVRVVTLAGTAPSARQVAWRTVLRLVDSLPLLYASGLISLMRTGPKRRQRLGDVVAGTTVALDPSGRPLRTPGWVLPMATILATIFSLLVVVRAIERPRGGGRTAAALGFSAGPGDEPVTGRWRASAQATSALGYSNIESGERYVRTWLISRACDAGCGLQLTVTLSHESPTTAPLIRTSDGWRATFPMRAYACGTAPDGRRIYWPQSSSMALRFTQGGRVAQGSERDFSEAAGCGYGTDTVAWTATRG